MIEDKQSTIESALNARITKIEDGRDNQHILLHLAPGNAKLPKKVHLPASPHTKLSEILLGESLDGPVVVDLNKTPHILEGGGTGSGKTTSIITTIYQLLSKTMNGQPAVNVTLIDLKGGQDYPPRWRSQDCNFTSDKEHALSYLSMAVEEIENRKILFSLTSERINAPCGNIDEYNRLNPDNPLRREVIVVDELAELTDASGMDKPHKELAAAIVANLSTIARLGRAFGINLILGVQRPDANAVPGQIKNNMDCRVCGKADNVLSMIILDNTDAATLIPKDSQGLFLTNDGVLFRAYLIDGR